MKTRYKIYAAIMGFTVLSVAVGVMSFKSSNNKPFSLVCDGGGKFKFVNNMMYVEHNNKMLICEEKRKGYILCKTDTGFENKDGVKGGYVAIKENEEGKTAELSAALEFDMDNPYVKSLFENDDKSAVSEKLCREAGLNYNKDLDMCVRKIDNCKIME